MRRMIIVACAVAAVGWSIGATAQDATVTITPDQLKWGPAAGLPSGWEEAVLLGDPKRNGPFVERIKLPPNAVVPPHTHPIAENITVLSGSFGIGAGAVADRSKGQILGPGSFYHLPANTPHFAWAGPEGAVIQTHGYGPQGIKMLPPKAVAQ